jgi:hypothetical protein
MIGSDMKLILSDLIGEAAFAIRHYTSVEDTHHPSSPNQWCVAWLRWSSKNKEASIKI